MCGIFAYLNYLTPKTRKEILDLLLNGKYPNSKDQTGKIVVHVNPKDFQFSENFCVPFSEL